MSYLTETQKELAAKIADALARGDAADFDTPEKADAMAEIATLKAEFRSTLAKPSKGDRVTVITFWGKHNAGGEGIMRKVDAVVTGAGTKKMTIESLDGECLGRNFDPIYVHPEQFDAMNNWTTTTIIIPEGEDVTEWVDAATRLWL